MDPRAHARLDTLHNAIHNLDIRLTTQWRNLHADVVNLTTRVTAGLTRADETRSWYIKFRGDTNEAIERLSRKLEETRDWHSTLRADLDETQDLANKLDDLNKLHQAEIEDLDGRLSEETAARLQLGSELVDLSHVVAEINQVYRGTTIDTVLKSYHESGFGMHIMLRGNPVEGFQAYGPYKTREDAELRAEHLAAADWWLIQLHAPEEAV